MTSIEFQAKVENGTIIVPEEYRQQFANGDMVKVTVCKHPEKKISEIGILAKLMRNPISVPGIRSITRDQMHER